MAEYRLEDVVFRVSRSRHGWSILVKSKADNQKLMRTRSNSVTDEVLKSVLVSTNRWIKHREALKSQETP